MARGFESKSVEEQQAEFTRRGDRAAEQPMTSPDIARAAERRTLELARARAEADLAAATRPAHRAMLEAALRALDEQLARRSQ